MIRTETRLRLLWLALACASLTTGLDGCGGGGGGGGGATPQPPAPAPSESAFLLAEFVAGDSNHQSVRVWDPAHPSVAVQDIKLVMSNGIPWTSSHLVFSDATRYDAATGTVTTLGHAKVFYDNDGKLYSIDLRGGRSHAPVQLSSAVDVFLPASATAMNAAGDDAWIDAQGGTAHWAIRASMGASDAPLPILQIVAPLRDAATGLPQYFLASLGERSAQHVVPPTYEIVDAGFNVQDVPAVAAMVASDGWAGADPAQPGLGYLQIAGGLHELHWGAGGVTVDPASLRAMGLIGTAAPVADAQSLYLSDGTTLLAVADGVVRTIGQFTNVPITLMEAGDYVAAVETDGATPSQPRYQVETLGKSGGAPTLVEPPATTLRLLAASDSGLILAGTVEQRQAFVLASGDNTVRTTLGSQWVGVVRSASARLGQPAAPVGLLSCVAGNGDFCAPGALTQMDLTGAGASVGTLTVDAPMLRVDAIAGLVNVLVGQTELLSLAGLASGQTDIRDAWQFTPATADSLARVTANLP